MIKIYIPHYTKLIDRKIDLISILDNQNITNYSFFEKYDKEDLLDEFTDDELEIRNRISKFIPENVINVFLSDKLNGAEKSLSLKHKYIYKDFLESSIDNDFLLVLEDDVRFVDNFIQIINKVIQKKFECIILGAGDEIKNIQNMNLAPSIFKFQISHNHPFKGGTESYIMSRGCAQKIYDFISDDYKMCIPIDWELSNLFMKNSIKAFEIMPKICYQASNTGEYNSSIRMRGDDYK